MPLIKEGQITDKIGKYDLFQFRSSVILVNGQESNLFYKSDIRNSFAMTLDGDIIRANSRMMKRAKKIEMNKFSNKKDITAIFKGKTIEFIDLRSEDFPAAAVVMSKNKNEPLVLAFTDKSSICLELAQYIDTHNVNIIQTQLKQNNDPIPLPHASFNLANAF